MKVCVFGLWHLGSVTAACLADAGFTVVGLDDTPDVTARLAQGQPPLFEPGLEDLVRSGSISGNLSFTADKSTVIDADVVWVTFDTPVDDDDQADVAFVTSHIGSLFPYLRDGAVVLVSSQLPVGTMAEIEQRFAAVANGRSVAFAYSPENLRLGKAIQAFRHPDRVIVGLRGDSGKNVIATLIAPFCSNIVWVGTEAAEMTKHAINAFLATCVTFINEIATVCEEVGADAQEVERALRSEPRIGPNAYIRPGAAFAGGTLARDVTFLSKIARDRDLPLDMIGHILASNRFHSGWPMRKLKSALKNLQGRRVALLGLAYKPGTDSVRRSHAVELASQLSTAGATVAAFDPAVTTLTGAHKDINIVGSLAEALLGADALVIMTEWPEFKLLLGEEVSRRMTTPIVIDQNRFLSHLAADSRVTYLTIGKPR